MKIIEVEINETRLSYDVFTWSDNNRANFPNCIVNVPILEETLKHLSKLIWENSLKVRKEVPSYFDEWNEPFPANDQDIYDNPLKLSEYFIKSSLWSDFIIEKLAQLQKWDFRNFIYHLLRLESVKIINDILYLNFYALNI